VNTKKYFPCLFASQLSKVQCFKFHLLFLYKIFVTKRIVGMQEKLFGQKFHERKKEKERFISLSLLSKFQVQR